MKSNASEDVVVKVSVYGKKGKKNLLVQFYNGQEKTFTTGRASLFRKGDLLYISDDAKGNSVSGTKLMVCRQEVIEDVKEFEGYYSATHFGGVGRIYLNLDDKMDLEPKTVTDNANTKEKIEEFAKSIGQTISHAEPVAEKQPQSNLSVLLARAIKQGKLEVAQAFVTVMDWMNKEGMDI